MPFPASEVEMTLVSDWVRKGISRPKFCTEMGSFRWMLITWMALIVLLRFPKFTAFTMATSMDSTSVAESEGFLLTGLLALDPSGVCCAKRVL